METWIHRAQLSSMAVMQKWSIALLASTAKKMLFRLSLLAPKLSREEGPLQKNAPFGAGSEKSRAVAHDGEGKKHFPAGGGVPEASLPLILLFPIEQKSIARLIGEFGKDNVVAAARTSEGPQNVGRPRKGRIPFHEAVYLQQWFEQEELEFRAKGRKHPIRDAEVAVYEMQYGLISALLLRTASCLDGIGSNNRRFRPWSVSASQISLAAGSRQKPCRVPLATFA